MTRTKLHPDQRRAELVAVARRLFTERGVDETSVSDIVKAAGVAQGTFYWYFKTKDDVLNAVVFGITDDIVSALAGLAQVPGLSAPEKLIRAAKMMYDVVLSDTAPLAHFHEDEHRRLHDELMRVTIARLTPVVAEVIRQGVAEGAFTAPQPDLAAALALSCAMPVGVEWPLKDAANWEMYMAAVTEFVLRGLGWKG